MTLRPFVVTMWTASMLLPIIVALWCNRSARTRILMTSLLLAIITMGLMMSVLVSMTSGPSHVG